MIFQAYARQKVYINHFGFARRESESLDDQTPQMLELNDHALIDCMVGLGVPRRDPRSPLLFAFGIRQANEDIFQKRQIQPLERCSRHSATEGCSIIHFGFCSMVTTSRSADTGDGGADDVK
jgi:hypothetical protein